jgi:hypothetical protein
MKAKTAAFILAFLLVSCSPPGTSIPTKSLAIKPTISAPINVSTPSPVPTSTIQSLQTFASPPSVWQIWFRGFSCEGVELCETGPNQISSYYSINSDGKDLKKLPISSFRSPQLPEGAPPLPDGFATVPQLSPDKSLLTYGARKDERYSLYIVNILTGKATQLYQAEKTEDHIFWIGTACWAADGKTIDFMLHSRIGRDNQPPVLYRINMDGSKLQALFSFPGLENAWFGACSPDGRELVLSIPGNMNVSENGLYLIHRGTGQLNQILSSYFASTVRVPQDEMP